MNKLQEKTLCKCGCGAVIDRYDKWYREKFYVQGHHRPMKNKKHSIETIENIRKNASRLFKESNPAWKGSSAGYFAKHRWMENNFGKPKKCEHCGRTDCRIDWANKNHTYRRIRTDWLRLCRSCHYKYDHA